MTDTETRAERVAAWQASGLSAVKFCEGRDFTAQRLWHWASKMRAAKRQKTTQADQVEPKRVRLARVVRAQVIGEGRSGGGSLAIEVQGLRVIVAPGFDRRTLSAVLDEIEARGRSRRGNG